MPPPRRTRKELFVPLAQAVGRHAAVTPGRGAGFQQEREDGRHRRGLGEARNANCSRPRVRSNQTFLPIRQATSTTGGMSTIDAALIAPGSSQPSPMIGMSDMNQSRLSGNPVVDGASASALPDDPGMRRFTECARFHAGCHPSAPMQSSGRVFPSAWMKRENSSGCDESRASRTNAADAPSPFRGYRQPLGDRLRRIAAQHHSRDRHLAIGQHARAEAGSAASTRAPRSASGVARAASPTSRQCCRIAASTHGIAAVSLPSGSTSNRVPAPSDSEHCRRSAARSGSRRRRPRRGSSSGNIRSAGTGRARLPRAGSRPSAASCAACRNGSSRYTPFR